MPSLTAVGEICILKREAFSGVNHVPQGGGENMENAKRKSILIVDDEEMVGGVACQLLDYLGYEPLHVYDGNEAFQEYKKRYLENSPFSVVIMDLTIPGGVGGREAIGMILSVDPNAKVVVSSGYSDDPIMLNYADYGFVGVLDKPFDLTTLEKSITDII